HQLTNNPSLQPITFRKTPQDQAQKQFSVLYGRCVGGSSVHFTANFWRFHEIDFVERRKVGEIPGAAFVDWPITYADLEPYYTKVEWEVGVSGLAGASPFDPPRSKPYPMPPLPVKSSGVLFERAARKLGYHPFPAPMAILSQPRGGRRLLGSCQRDPYSRAHRPLRDSPQLLCSPDRDRQEWSRHRCRVLRRAPQCAAAKSQSRDRLCQRGGDSQAPVALRKQRLSERPGE